MKLDFSKMDIGRSQFNFVRTLMVAPTGGAEVSECLKAAANIKDKDEEGWIREWASIAEKVLQIAEEAMQSGQAITARGAYMRASNYYRAAMFSLPPTDDRLNKFMTLSRETFRKAAKLFSPPIEVVDIPFGKARLPAYFLSAGQSKLLTLIAINGGDSINEELVHWIGFAAVARGWNCLIFEGPGQWSALQLNPGLYLRPDYEAPVKVVVDYLTQRNDIDPDHIALIGYSLSSQLAPSAAALEKRISACICVGGVITDVNEAFESVWPALRYALPGVFDHVFTALEKVSPQLHGLANQFRYSFGISKPHELLGAWRPFNIKDLAPKIQCPFLVLIGEGEYEQTDARVVLSTLHFISELTCPVAIHEFEYKDGWVASHCSVGDEGPSQRVIFDWLDRTLIKEDSSIKAVLLPDWSLLMKYQHSSEIDKLLQNIRVSVV
ncbi:MAG: alpha/beta hydrolase [Anaerolineales bacterium]